MLIRSVDQAYFYDGMRLVAIDRRDLSSLYGSYVLLDVDRDYLVYMKRYGFTPEFALVLETLMSLEDSGILITKAEFSNNSNIENGILDLVFEGLGAELVVEDLSKLGYLGECIEMISSDIQKERYDTIFSKRIYRLESSGLFRMKR